MTSFLLAIYFVLVLSKWHGCQFIHMITNPKFADFILIQINPNISLIE